MRCCANQHSYWPIRIRTPAHVLLCDSADVRNNGAAVRNGAAVQRRLTVICVLILLAIDMKCEHFH